MFSRARCVEILDGAGANSCWQTLRHRVDKSALFGGDLEVHDESVVGDGWTVSGRFR